MYCCQVVGRKVCGKAKFVRFHRMGAIVILCKVCRHEPFCCGETEPQMIAAPKPIRLKTKRRPKTKRTNRRKYADILWSKYIKARARGKCQRCGSQTMALEAAHIIPRRVLPTRFDTRNGIALCAATCHRDFDSAASALIRISLIQGWIGNLVYEELLAKARTRWGGDYDSPIKELGQLLREAKRAA